jgi:hypothetical protein
MVELPLYSIKFSNKLHTHYQHLYLLIYKQFRKFMYEELLTDIAGNSEIRIYLGLNKLPHYTTLVKFAQKLPCKILDKLVLTFKKLIPKPKKVAIDATGFNPDNTSLHYCKRIGKPAKKQNRNHQQHDQKTIQQQH